jgi:hypothetical protein
MKKILFNVFCFVVVFGSVVSAQSFEGVIVYQTKLYNPDTQNISDSVWNSSILEELGLDGSMKQTYYYKKSNYLIEIETKKTSGYQLFVPRRSMIYSWERNSDTAVAVNAAKSIDIVREVKELEGTETIAGVLCRKLLITTNFGEIIVWYNPDYLVTDPFLFREHHYNQWETILSHTRAIPFRIEQKNGMLHAVQTLVSFESKAINDSKFNLPEFTYIHNAIE